VLLQGSRDATRAGNPLLLDGYPRTLRQATDAARAKLAIAAVISLDVPISIALARLRTRESHSQRPEDAVAATRTRFAIWNSVTVPMLRYYEERRLLVTVDATGTESAVSAMLAATVSTLNLPRVQPRPRGGRGS